MRKLKQQRHPYWYVELGVVEDLDGEPGIVDPMYMGISSLSGTFNLYGDRSRAERFDSREAAERALLDWLQSDGGFYFGDDTFRFKIVEVGRKKTPSKRKAILPEPGSVWRSSDGQLYFISAVLQAQHSPPARSEHKAINDDHEVSVYVMQTGEHVEAFALSHKQWRRFVRGSSLRQVYRPKGIHS